MPRRKRRKRSSKAEDVCPPLEMPESVEGFRVALVKLIQIKKPSLLTSSEDSAASVKRLLDLPLKTPKPQQASTSWWNYRRRQKVPRRSAGTLRALLSQLLVRDLRNFLRPRLSREAVSTLSRINKDAIVDSLAERFHSGAELTFSRRDEERQVLAEIGPNAQFSAILCGIDLPVDIVKLILSFSGCSHELLISLGATCYGWYATLLTCWVGKIKISRRNVLQVPAIVLGRTKSISITERLNRAGWKHLYECLNKDRLQEMEIVVASRTMLSKSITDLCQAVRKGKVKFCGVKKFLLTYSSSYKNSSEIFAWTLSYAVPNVTHVETVPAGCLGLLMGLEQLTFVRFAFRSDEDIASIPTSVAGLDITVMPTSGFVGKLGFSAPPEMPSIRTLEKISQTPSIHLLKFRESQSEEDRSLNRRYWRRYRPQGVFEVINAELVLPALRNIREIDVRGMWNLHLCCENLVSLNVSCWFIETIQCARNAMPHLQVVQLQGTFAVRHGDSQTTSLPTEQALNEASKLIQERGAKMDRIAVGVSAEFVAVSRSRGRGGFELFVEDGEQGWRRQDAPVAPNSIRIVDLLLRDDVTSLDWISKVSCRFVDAKANTLNFGRSKLKEWMLSFPYGDREGTVFQPAGGQGTWGAWGGYRSVPKTTDASRFRFVATARKFSLPEDSGETKSVRRRRCSVM